MEKKKPVILSGIQPSGELALGNFLGAVKNWLQMLETHDCFFMIVDLHAITVTQKPAELRKRCLSFAMQYLALGLDPDKCSIFLQSHVPAHSQLAWVLNCYSYMGELNRMTQFKEKSQKHEANINVGLFSYPVLMAADILLYQTDLVPVGADQKQHLELTRDIAIRFNNQFEGGCFKVPEPFIPETGARIMSLLDPHSKMSKSDENNQNFIGLLDPPELILKKFKRAVTDSEAKVRFDPVNQPGISNLITILSLLTDKNPLKVTEEFSNRGYGELKIKVAEAVIETLRPTREKFIELEKNSDFVHGILSQGALKAKRTAQRTLDKVYKKIGLIPALT